jgi:hypothetical protein
LGDVEGGRGWAAGGGGGWGYGGRPASMVMSGTAARIKNAGGHAGPASGERGDVGGREGTRA